MFGPYPQSSKSARRSLALVCGLVVATPSCIWVDHDDDHGYVDDGPPVYQEQEPNDSSSNPDYIKRLHDHDHLIVEGHIDDGGPDEFDGFAFTAREPMVVHFELYAYRSGADLDLGIYDPWIDDWVDFFETPNNPEVGSFVVDGFDVDFHMVVESFERSSDYDLEIWTEPYDCGCNGPAGGDDGGASDGVEPGEHPRVRALDADPAGPSIAPRAERPSDRHRYLGRAREREPEPAPNGLLLVPNEAGDGFDLVLPIRVQDDRDGEG